MNKSEVESVSSPMSRPLDVRVGDVVPVTEEYTLGFFV